MCTLHAIKQFRFHVQIVFVAQEIDLFLNAMHVTETLGLHRLTKEGGRMKEEGGRRKEEGIIYK